MRSNEQIQDEFNQYYEKLEKLEERFQSQLTHYSIGDKVKVSDIDKTYKDIKSILKEIRKLAIELKKVR